jgi:glycosyltransferase involved in cell wall biosynthesis
MWDYFHNDYTSLDNKNSMLPIPTNYKISIIVPVFNAEKFIDVCINSLISQTYSNLELILVNDGSTDDSLNLLMHYKNLYRNIIIVNKINEGPGIARNAGLDIASGDFVMFLDADDYLIDSCCENVIEYMKNSDADFVCYGAKFFSSGKNTISGFSYSYKEIKSFDILINYLATGEIKSVVWNKIYRKSTIDKHAIRFPINRINEDAMFVMKMSLYAKFIKLVPGVFYFHTSCNPMSFTNNISIEHFLNSIEVLNAEKTLLVNEDIYEALEVHYKTHAAKLLFYLIILGALNLNRYVDFLYCLNVIFRSDVWLKLNQSSVFELPVGISLRILLCRQKRFCWIMAKVMRKIGITLQ